MADLELETFIERMEFVEGVLGELPEICRKGLFEQEAQPECAHCWATLNRGYVRGWEPRQAQEAREKIVLHMSNQECEGAAQLRRRAANLQLIAIGRATEGPA